MVIFKEKIDIEDLLEVTTAMENVCLTLEEPAGTKEAQVRADREARNEDAIRVWREEETRRSDEEKRLFRGSTTGEADKRLTPKMFLPLGKQV